MNAPLQLPRQKFTVDQVRAMVVAGLADEDAPYELIDGELVEMAHDGPRHMDWSYAVMRWLTRALGEDHVVMAGGSLRLSDENAPKPDWWVFPAALETAAVRGADVMLAVEIADSSLDRDLGWKADLYARYGVRDYWAIDVHQRRVRVHREPGPDGYGLRRWHGDDEAVEALLLPGLALRLRDLPRVG